MNSSGARGWFRWPTRCSGTWKRQQTMPRSGQCSRIWPERSLIRRRVWRTSRPPRRGSGGSCGWLRTLRRCRVGRAKKPYAVYPPDHSERHVVRWVSPLEISGRGFAEIGIRVRGSAPRAPEGEAISRAAKAMLQFVRISWDELSLVTLTILDPRKERPLDLYAHAFPRAYGARAHLFPIRALSFIEVSHA